ncbi:MAG: DNA glycosylase AlkZ-like family protein, partial [Aestuariivirgaceae bacterium]
MSGFLSIEQARRIALAAQLAPGARRPKSPPGPAAIGKLIGALNLLQIDSVNVLSRSHYLPVFSRLGPYDRAILDALTFSTRKRRCFEYWAHEASFLPFEHFPLFRWRMDAARHGESIYKGLVQFQREQPQYIAAILDEIRRRGPLAVRDLPDPGKRLPGWWGWSPGKIALEYLFWTGEVTAATRRNFERLYDLTERVIPPEIFHAPQIPRAEAVRELMRLSARALGLAT